MEQLTTYNEAYTKERPLVSVIILSYRHFEGIYESLDSIFKQDYPNIEVIISDDGSEGFIEEKQKITTYIESKRNVNISSFIIIANRSNSGTVRNMNIALIQSHGKYLKSLSPEDIFTSDAALSEYVTYIENSESKVIFAKMRGVLPDGSYKNHLSACEDNYELLKTFTVEQTRNKLFARDFLPGVAEMIDRDIFCTYGLYPEDTRLIEDYPLWLYLAEQNVTFDYLDKVLIDYKLSGVSSSGSYSALFMEDMYIIYNRYIFPFDKRYGLLQPIYNNLKKRGLDYYMYLATKDKYSKSQRFAKNILYLPYYIYTHFANS